MKHLSYIAIFFMVIQGCCNAPDPVLPKFKTPYGYDQILVKSIPLYDEDNLVMATCRPIDCDNVFNSFVNTDVKNTRILKDSFPSCLEECFRDSERFSEINFRENNLTIAFFGSSGQVIKSAFQYAVYVNHDAQTVLIKGVIVGSGSCAGSGLSSRSYERAFLLPKQLENYTLTIESNVLK